jgi:hypothetical protein
MMPSSPLPFPNRRTLAAWWRQISQIRPAHRGPAFWVAHLWVHHVEALARVSRQVQTDRFTSLLLETLATGPGSAAAPLQLVFPFGGTAIQRMLYELESEGLIDTRSSSKWQLSERGQTARVKGAYATEEQQRRFFHFVADDRPDCTPHFLLIRKRGLGHRIDGEFSFQPRHVFETAGKDADWKRRHNFPLDVDEVLPPNTDGTLDWRRIILHHVEILPVVVTIESTRLHGFHAESNAESLDVKTPVFELGDCWPDVFPDLAHEPSANQWHQAWCEWANHQKISSADAGKCRVERREHRLRVHATRAILDRLRAARHEPLKSENCVLAGEGRFRAAAPLEIVTA